MVSQDNHQPQPGQSETLQLSCFYLGDTLFGVDINLVQEINEDLRFTKVPLAPDYVLGIMNLRGQIVTVIELGKKIGFPPSEINSQSRVIIVKSENEAIGLLVERVTEVLTIRSTEIVTPPSNIKGAQGKFFQGVVQTTRQELLALLDIDTVLEEE